MTTEQVRAEVVSPCPPGLTPERWAVLTRAARGMDLHYQHGANIRSIRGDNGSDGGGTMSEPGAAQTAPAQANPDDPGASDMNDSQTTPVHADRGR